MQPHVLIVRPEAFRFGWRGAATRILDAATAIESLDWSLAMLTSSPVTSRPPQSPEAAFPGEFFSTPFTGDYPAAIDRRPKLRRLYRGLWKLRGATYYHWRLATGWATRVRTWLESNWPDERPSCVWAIGSQDLNSLIGARFIAEHFAAPLVLDLNDPPTSSQMGRLHPCLDGEFEKCLKASAAVITTTQSYADHLVAKHNLPADRVRPIYLSYPDDAAAAAGNGTRSHSGLTLLHAGTLHSGTGRNARSLVESIAAFIAKNPQARGQIRLRLLGGGIGADEAQRLAVQLGLNDAVQALPPVSFREVQTEMSQADALVVIKFADSAHDMQIPGKLFQYLPQRKPILGIMGPHTEAAELLRESGLGLIAGNDDVPRIAGWLDRLWQTRGASAGQVTPNESFIRRFSRSAAQEQFVEVLSGVVDLLPDGWRVVAA